MSVVDVNAFAGAYPYRHLPHTEVGWLITQMARLGIQRAWVAHLPSLLLKDPAPAQEELFRLLGPHRHRLLPVPVVNPSLPRWERDVERARREGCPGVRLFPQYQGIDPAGPAMRAALRAAAEAGLVVVLTVRLEDARQRHPLDAAGELPPGAVRALLRVQPDARVVVTQADRAFIEEVHFGLTPEEAARVLWDVSWVWGPPIDDLRLLLETIGADRFVLGTGMPLRIPDAAFARLDLEDLSDAARRAVLGGNLARWTGSR